jgi:monovalent cation:H+ antiporter, CPA1 family
MHPPAVFSGVLVLLVVAVAVSIAARHSRVPYTVGLVLAGLIIGLIPNHPTFTITPDLVMVVFLPALLFAGAWTYPRGELRRNWLVIVLLATVGVVVCMVVSWFVLTRFAGMPSATALMFGAIVSATDPVAVMAVFRTLGTAPRLNAIVEGESLFNDATAVVAYKMTLVLTTSTLHPGALEPVLEFVRLLAGGVVIGLAVGGIGLLVLRLTEDYMVEAMGTLLIAYGSYYLADIFGFSGLIAVIVAGMLIARVGMRSGALTATRASVNQLWEFIAFAANSMLFLLVGLSINLENAGSMLTLTGWSIGAVVLARALTVYGLCAVAALGGAGLPMRWQHILALGGLRGALSMALVLSLPAAFPQRELLLGMVFSVVLFTIIVQGLALAPAILGLRLQHKPLGHRP